MTEGNLRRLSSSKKKVKFAASLKKRSSSTGAIRNSSEREPETRETAQFRLQFTQGDLHCRLSHNTPPGHLPRHLEWDTDLTLMSDEQRCALLIKFSNAMGIMSHPCRIVAEQGMIDLLSTAEDVSSVMAAIPAIVNGIRSTLLHFDQSKRVYALKIMYMLTSIHGCGPNLVQFYGRLLAPLRKFSYRGIQQDICYSKGPQWDDMVEEALQHLERTGGPKATEAIRSVLPYYVPL